MHIGFVHTKILGEEGVGSAHSASKLVYELAESGHEITVYCPNKTGRSGDVDTGSNITVEILDVGANHRFVPDQKFAAVGRRLRDRAAEFEEFDVVHSYISGMSWLVEISNRVSTPVITTLNSYDAVCPKGDLFYKDSEPCRQAGPARCAECICSSTVFPETSDVYDGASVFDKYGGAKRIPATAYLLVKRFRNLRAVSGVEEIADQLEMYHVLADHLRETYTSLGFPEDRFRVVPNMLDERFLMPHRSDFEEPYRLLYVGSLIRKKGVQRLVPLLEYLDARYECDYELTIVGDGYLQPRLEKEARQTDLDVTLTGRISYTELPDVYASHDIFVYPGIWQEPFGRVFLEALATGTPMVGSRVGNLAEVVDGAGVVTDGSVEGLAEGIHELSETRELEERSRRAKRRAVQFRPDEVVPQFEQLYEETIRRTTE